MNAAAGGIALRTALALRLLVNAASVGIVLFAMKAGYDFGAQLSGWVLGAVIAANAGLFCALVVGALAERLLQPLVERPAAAAPRDAA